jgi:hypothetical protein
VLRVRVLVDLGHAKVTTVLDPLVDDYRARGHLDIDYKPLGDGDGSADEFRRLLTEPTDLLLVDGHGCYDDQANPWLMGIGLTSLPAAPRPIQAAGLVLGACEGGSSGFVDQIERSLQRQLAFMGCGVAAPYSHGAVLWPYLFRALEKASLAGVGGSQADLIAVMTTALRAARHDRGRMQWDRWEARLLNPAIGDRSVGRTVPGGSATKKMTAAPPPAASASRLPAGRCPTDVKQRPAGLDRRRPSGRPG